MPIPGSGPRRARTHSKPAVDIGRCTTRRTSMTTAPDARHVRRLVALTVVAAALTFGCGSDGDGPPSSVELPELAPGDSAPGESAPTEPTPPDTAPAATAPAETAPPETAPPETGHRRRRRRPRRCHRRRTHRPSPLRPRPTRNRGRVRSGCSSWAAWCWSRCSWVCSSVVVEAARPPAPGRSSSTGCCSADARSTTARC